MLRGTTANFTANVVLCPHKVRKILLGLVDMFSINVFAKMHVHSVDKWLVVWHTLSILFRAETDNLWG